MNKIIFEVDANKDNINLASNMSQLMTAGELSQTVVNNNNDSDLLKKISDLEHDKECYEVQIDELQIQILQLKQVSVNNNDAMITALKNDLEVLKAELEKKNNEVIQLSGQLNNIKIDQDMTEELTKKISTLDADNQAKDQTIADLQTRINTFQDNLEEAECDSNTADLEVSITDLEVSITDLEDEIENNKGVIKNLTTENEEFIKQINDLKAQLENQSEKDKKIESLEFQIQDLKRTDHHEAEIKKYEEQIVGLKQTLDYNSAELETAKHTVSTIEEAKKLEIELLKTEISQLKRGEEITNLKAQLEAKDREIEFVKKANDKVKADLEKEFNNKQARMQEVLQEKLENIESKDEEPQQEEETEQEEVQETLENKDEEKAVDEFINEIKCLEFPRDTKFYEEKFLFFGCNIPLSYIEKQNWQDVKNELIRTIKNPDADCGVSKLKKLTKAYTKSVTENDLKKVANKVGVSLAKIKESYLNKYEIDFDKADSNQCRELQVLMKATLNKPAPEVKGKNDKIKAIAEKGDVSFETLGALIKELSSDKTKQTLVKGYMSKVCNKMGIQQTELKDNAEAINEIFKEISNL